MKILSTPSSEIWKKRAPFYTTLYTLLIIVKQKKKKQKKKKRNKFKMENKQTNKQS